MSFIISFARKEGEIISDAVGGKYLVTSKNLKSFELWAKTSMENTIKLEERIEERKIAEEDTVGEAHFLDIEKDRMTKFLEACTDPEKSERGKECLLCFYNKQDLHFQSVPTSWRCQICLHKFEHENSLVPILCPRCASRQGLCPTCGGVHFQPTTEFRKEIQEFCKQHFESNTHPMATNGTRQVRKNPLKKSFTKIFNPPSNVKLV